MAPLVEKFKNDTKSFTTKICVTAQHREMLDQVLDLFKITPDYDLNIMRSDQDLYDVTSSILLKIKPVLEEFEPDLVLVHGDTATTFSTSLAAYYQKIKVAHVEAGLRTGNLLSPWPEEGNRRLTSVLADYHFAPTKNSKENLLKEGIDETSIFITGNTVIDALKLVLNRIHTDELLKFNIEKSIFKSGFKELNSKFLLVTGHRRENFGQGFFNICEALKVLAKNNPHIIILYPVHLNPNVKIIVNNMLSKIENIILVEPYKYEEFVYLMSKSYLILTDSGGIQEEAPSLGKPVLVMRNATERPEAVLAGTVKIVGSNQSEIIEKAQELIDDPKEYQRMSQTHNPYGNGDSSNTIVNILRNEL